MRPNHYLLALAIACLPGCAAGRASIETLSSVSFRTGVFLSEGLPHALVGRHLLANETDASNSTGDVPAEIREPVMNAQAR